MANPDTIKAAVRMDSNQLQVREMPTPGPDGKKAQT